MSPNAGGAAAMQGADYQSRVAAWLAARSMATAVASPLWAWSPDSRIQAVHIETSDEVDDIRVDAGTGASAFIQAKHHVRASSTLSSPLGKAMQQFVAQLPQTGPDDRLVLATASGSSRRITETLPVLLQRARQSDATSMAVLCRNSYEESLHDALIALIGACWQEEYQRAPTEAELLKLLSRLFVTQVDPYGDEREVREAKQLLRGRLVAPNQADAAWETLVSLASQTGILRSQLTPAWLLDQLEAQGIATSTAPEFRGDIQRLQRRSAEVADRLTDFESITGDDGSPVRIERAFAADLADAAQASLLITGEPGSGKSGSVSRLVAGLDASTDVLFLAADSLAAKSLGELRAELGLQHDLADVLTGWRGTGPAYLVIDALDAGRGSENQRALLDLMRLVIRSRSRWRVIATVRRFDLLYNEDLRDLFPGSSGDDGRYHLPELIGVRHFAIPEVGDDELEQLGASSPELFRQIEAAPRAIRQMLTNLFGLRIFADLVASQDLNSGSTMPASQSALLDRYWSKRVRNGSGALRREEVLRLICDRMLNDGTLTVPRSQVLGVDNADDIDELLHRGVLVARQDAETAVRRIGFAHHVLFDYAVSVLVLQDHSRTLAELVTADRTLLFLVRPSFEMLFERVWELDPGRGLFWEAALHLSREPNVPEIARVIAPSIAAARIAGVQDVAPLVVALTGDRDAASRMLRHFITAHLNGRDDRSTQDAARSTWVELLESLIPHLDHDIASSFRNLLYVLLEDRSSWSPSDLEILGRASRHLLRWLWSIGTTSRWYLGAALRGVAETFQTDPSETKELLVSLLSMEHLGERGYAELPVLAEHVERLWQIDPTLVQQVYTAAFEFEETSREATPLTMGVLSMTSNRRQDYEHAHYVLAQRFPAFLLGAPGAAIEALAVIWRKYSMRFGSQPRWVEVPWPDAPVRILDDFRFDSLEHGHDEEEQMLGQLETWLREDVAQRAGVAVELLRSLAAPAALWRVLLRTLSESGASLTLLMPLLTAPPALLSTGLSVAIGEALRRGFAHLVPHDRIRIEAAIDALDGSEERDRVDRIRDRLLSALPADALVTAAARERRVELAAAGGIVERPTVPEVRPYMRGEDEYLRDRDIDPGRPENERLRRAGAPVRAFNTAYLNARPDPAATRELWPHIRATWEEAALAAADTALIESTMSDVTLALEVLVRTDWPVELGEDDLEHLHAITLALSDADPPPDPPATEDINLDVYGAGAPRPSAATIIASLLRHSVGTPLRPRFLELSTDPSVHVRRAVVMGLNQILEVDRAAVNEIVDRESEHETSGTVLTHLIWLVTRLHLDPGALLARVEHLYRRALVLGDRGKPVREAACRIAAGWHIWQDAPEALAFADQVLSGASTPAYEFGALEDEFRQGFESEDGEVRARAFALALRTQRVAAERARAAIEAFQEAPESDRATEREEMQQWGGVIEGIANDVYFASGAYQRGDDADPRPRPPIDGYYRLARELLQALLEVPYPSVVHRVIETLGYLSPADPAAIFIEIGHAVACGREGSYEADLLGEPLLVSIVRRYLAHDRGLFQSSPACRDALVDILDALVGSGSRDAMALTYQLQEVFR